MICTASCRGAMLRLRCTGGKPVEEQVLGVEWLYIMGQCACTKERINGQELHVRASVDYHGF